MDPYLFLDGRCEEAIAFYARALGAEVELLTRLKDVPGMPVRPGAEGRIMHAQLRIGETRLLASDGEQGGFGGFSLALSAASDVEAERLFEALREQGSVELPMAATPFASRFGMLRDRYGVHWTVVHQPTP